MSSDSQILTASPDEEGPNGTVVHLSELSADLRNLRLSDDMTDAVLIVEKKRFPVHRVILAARCEYFRALFYGGMRESAHDPELEVELKETPAEAFSHFLRYAYEGQIQLASLGSQTILELVALANRFNLSALQIAVCDYLVCNLTVSNACSTMDMAIFFQLDRVRDSCSAFIDVNALNVLKSDSFLQLSRVALMEMLQRDSFYAPEIEIFEAVAEWCKANADQYRTVSLDLASPAAEKEDPSSSCIGTDGSVPLFDDVLACLRLPLMSIEDLFGEVRRSALFSDSFLLDSIEKRVVKQGVEPCYRGRMIRDKWLVSPSCAVLGGSNTSMLLTQGGGAAGANGPSHRIAANVDADTDPDSAEGIAVRLPCAHVVNHISLTLMNKGVHFSSFVVYVGLDSGERGQAVSYRQLFDYSQFHCRARQELFFDPCVVQYIKVVGMSASYSPREFQLFKIDAMYSSKVPTFRDGFKVPDDNVAHAHTDAVVMEGVSRIRHSVIDGHYRDYDWDTGYTCHQIDNGCIIIMLAQPIYTSSMRFLLWDCDERQYSYCVDVSRDNVAYHRVCDKSKFLCRSWQTIAFDMQLVSYIKLLGTFNTANEVFHCVHFECPSSPSTDSLAASSAEMKPDVES